MGGRGRRAVRWLVTRLGRSLAFPALLLFLLARPARFGGGLGGIGRKAERGAADQPGDGAASHALGANANPRVGAAGRRDANALQVRFELPAADAGHLRADAAEVLGAAARADLIA